MKIKKKHIFRFFGPFFSSFIIFGWDFVENEKNHQKSTVILLHFWLSKQKNYFWSHAKLAKMSSFQCTVRRSRGTVQEEQWAVYNIEEESSANSANGLMCNRWYCGAKQEKKRWPALQEPVSKMYTGFARKMRVAQCIGIVHTHNENERRKQGVREWHRAIMIHV